MQASYLGWVPCLTGQLDFSLMEPGQVGNLMSLQSKHTAKICINLACQQTPSPHRLILLHSHKHHKQDQDALTTVIPCLLADETPHRPHDSRPDQQEKTHLAQKLQNQLQREITQMKRSATQSFGYVHEYHKAKGILAYLQSLTLTLKNRGFIDEKQEQQDIKYIQALNQSIEAQINKIKDQNTLASQEWTASRARIGLALAFAALFSAIYLRTHELEPKKIPPAESLVAYWLDQLFFSYSFFIVFILLVHIISARYIIKLKGNYDIFAAFVSKQYQVGYQGQQFSQPWLLWLKGHFYTNSALYIAMLPLVIATLSLAQWLF